MGVRHLQSLPTGDAVAVRSMSNPVVEQTPSPEPVRLYHLITLAFLLHTPSADRACSCCGRTWPCQQVRLAYRLREGF